MTARELVSPSRRSFLTATSAIGGGLLLGIATGKRIRKLPIANQGAST